ncbi:MAG TPA: hypothetical protein VMI32_16865 [Candidatus Solibacter sp.]|nr:hypothetical protein [Candidatus Solibacter sp.]
MKLHELHARRLEATLSRADEAIHRMESLLMNDEQDGAVRKIENKLSPKSRETLLAKLHTLKIMLAGMAESFSLQPHPLDTRRVLNAEISTLWVQLEDCRPRRMKGYGQQFSQQASAALEEAVEELLQHVLAMRKGLD